MVVGCIALVVHQCRFSLHVKANLQDFLLAPTVIGTGLLGSRAFLPGLVTDLLAVTGVRVLWAYMTRQLREVLPEVTFRCMG